MWQKKANYLFQHLCLPHFWAVWQEYEQPGGSEKFRRINECIKYLLSSFGFVADHSKCLTAALAPKSSPLVQQSHLCTLQGH
jgi:hypothetical protein